MRWGVLMIAASELRDRWIAADSGGELLVCMFGQVRANLPEWKA